MRLDPQSVGEKEAWTHATFTDPIKLPGTTDEAHYGEKTVGATENMLTRLYTFIGPAWYQRDIEIPPTWAGREVELLLERVTWESKVWVDDQAADSQDSLGTPHRHQLGKLAPGKHRLTIRVNNDMIHPIGDRGHCYTEHTQTIWNGVVGKIELRARAPLHLGLVRTFPDTDGRKVEAEVCLVNDTGATQKGTLRFVLTENKSGHVAARGETPFSADGAQTVVRPAISLTDAPKLWDEFDPNLYTLQVTLDAGATQDTTTTILGFRTLGQSGHHFAINGHPVYFRGNTDNVHFPLTGYPPCEVEGWRRVFRVYQAHGLNFMRCHSWCPPEAAFEAADEMGICIQVEVLWIDWWMTKENPKRPDMLTKGHPVAVGKNDRSIDEYVRAEMRRMLNAYGNHPSFACFVIGNELGTSDFKVMGEWIKAEKERDPRHLYAASSARKITPYDDFADTHNYPGAGSTVNKLQTPSTDWDYENTCSKASLPILAHELGQMAVSPAWDEIKKYTGVTRARNFEKFRESAVKNGVADQDKDFQAASGAMNRFLYKNEIEAQLRTPDGGGFALLGMTDYSGQGEAMIGWLDSFYDSKGFLSPEQFRRYCNPTVPLARFAKYVWSNGEKFHATAQVSHYGPKPLENILPVWRLRDAQGKTIAEGKLPAATLALGGVTTLGEIDVDLAQLKDAEKLNLELSLGGTSFANDWDLWVFPTQPETAEPTEIIVTDELNNALDALSKGNKVLLLANKLGDKQTSRAAQWSPIFWSAPFIPGQNNTMGALVQNRHPALAAFPTDSHLDWQWRTLCSGSHCFVLNALPHELLPIVQPIGDFHYNDKLGSIFELRTHEGGRLLVCGYDVASKLADRPEARQLRHSLLTYMAGAKFAPKIEVTAADLKKLFPPGAQPAPIATTPPTAEKSLLYVRAGGNHPGGGDVPWKTEVDNVKTAAQGFGYTVKCDNVWKDNVSSAWHGQTLRVEIKLPKTGRYSFYAHFHDWDSDTRTGSLTFGGRKYTLAKHSGDGRWVKLEVAPEDCSDGKFILDAECETGSNLMITAIALTPAE